VGDTITNNVSWEGKISKREPKRKKEASERTRRIAPEGVLPHGQLTAGQRKPGEGGGQERWLIVILAG